MRMSEIYSEPLHTNSTGAWGERTSTLDWCELNYEVTPYIAEFWNTISNSIMIILPVYCIIWTYKHYCRKVQYFHDLKKLDFHHNKSNLRIKYEDQTFFEVPWSVVACYFGIILVGVGSWLFHMTLKYEMQLLDELPMIVTSGISIYASYELLYFIDQHEQKTKLVTSVSNPPKSSKKSSSKSLLRQMFECRPLILFLCVFYCLTVCYVYVFVWNNFSFHQFAFGFLIALVSAENFLIIYKLKLNLSLYLYSFLFYVLGTLFWTVDNEFCPYLREYRRFLDRHLLNSPDPTTASDHLAASSYSPIFIVKYIIVALLKSLSEFHAIWHILTCYGCFLTLLFLLEAHHQFNISITDPLIKEDDSLKNANPAVLKRLPSNIAKPASPVVSKFYNLVHHLEHDVFQKTKQN